MRSHAELTLTMKTWWFNLSSREKQIVTAGGICLSIFLIYALIWSPLVNHATSLRARIAQEQKLLVFMQTADKEIHRIQQQAQKKDKPNSPIELLTLLQKQIKQAGLTQNLSQLKEGANDTVVMSFQRVEFDKLMSLLIATMKQHSINITQMSASADTTIGLVNAEVILS